MANLNKVMLIGRLTRDPEQIPTRGGSVGAKFGFAVNNRKLNQESQKWDDVPVFIDMEIWNRGENQQATRLLQTLRKGQQVYIEGHLRLDTWTESPEKGGAKRSALRVVVDNFQYLEPKQDGMDTGGEPVARSNGRPTSTTSRAPSPARNAPAPQVYDDEPDMSAPPARSGRGSETSEDDIPF